MLLSREDIDSGCRGLLSTLPGPLYRLPYGASGILIEFQLPLPVGMEVFFLGPFFGAVWGIGPHWADCCPLLLDERPGDTRPKLPSTLELEGCEMPSVPTGVANEVGMGLPAALGVGQGIKLPDLVFIADSGSGIVDSLATRIMESRVRPPASTLLGCPFTAPLIRKSMLGAFF